MDKRISTSSYCFSFVALCTHDMSAAPPIVESMTPTCMPHDVPTTVSFHGKQFFDPPEQGLIVVRWLLNSYHIMRLWDDLCRIFDGYTKLISLVTQSPSYETHSSSEPQLYFTSHMRFSEPSGTVVDLPGMQTWHVMAQSPHLIWRITHQNTPHIKASCSLLFCSLLHFMWWSAQLLHLMCCMRIR